tara:strand:+ start:197 stop:601 length:405 start_codon:yes stop_codon:yes gene_type:complete
MTLKQLINKSSYKSVFNLLYKWHLKNKKKEEIVALDMKFLEAWNDLSSLQPIPESDLEIYLKKIDSTEIDVCLRCISENSFYALDFFDWEKLIDLQINNNTSLSDKEVMASILWEITFWGFSSKTVKASSKKLE